MHNMVTLNRLELSLLGKWRRLLNSAGTEATLADGALVQLVHEL